MGRKRTLRKFIAALALAVLIVWPVYNIYGYLQPQGRAADAARLLYQVALFQMELLNNSLAESSKARTASGLNSLRLAAYSANFAHERLVLAYGEDRLAKLHSVEKLLQYVLRVQIGGERAVRAEEQETLAMASEQFAAIYEVYGKLLHSSGKPSSSADGELRKLDKQLSELLEKRLMP